MSNSWYKNDDKGETRERGMLCVYVNTHIYGCNGDFQSRGACRLKDNMETSKINFSSFPVLLGQALIIKGESLL